MFNTLNYDEQLTRLTALARVALRHYGIPDADLTLACYTNNAVFKAGQFALRIHRPGLKKRIWIESELAWLAALDDLNVPQPAGDVYTGTLAGVDDPVYCVLFTWVDGAAVTELTATHARQIGEFAARLHEHPFTPPPGFERPTLDFEGLFGVNSPYASEQEDDFFTDEQREVIAAVAAEVGAVMQQDRNFGLIHGDLITKNIVFDGGKIGVIDFDDCAYGYHLYDLTPILWVNRKSPNYVELRNGLLQGDAHQLETYVAARHVASCRWIAGNAAHPALRGQAHEIIAQRIQELEHFLQTGLFYEGYHAG